MGATPLMARLELDLIGGKRNPIYAEVERLSAVEAAAMEVVEAAGTYPSRPLYAAINELRAALGKS